MTDRSASVSPELLKAMADTIAHRGPDDDGYYLNGPVALGFRRLAIIDLSGGHQPLSNEDGSVWIVFNGEIYNYQELRSLLLSKGHQFRTQSDTEVIVHLYEEFGEDCVSKLRGMFGFAIWDSRNQSLLLARDRVGIKPVYYTATRDALLFASEIKALLADPTVRAEVEPAMIDRFLTFDYTPGEETLFRGIKKLSPGHYLTVRNGKIAIKQYWDLKFETREISEADAERELLRILEESVRLHMISDVPVGFLLSGGLDSTAMLSLASTKTDKKTSSFTVGFSDPGVIDERPYARLAAERFHSEHYELSITSKDFADFMPGYIWHMEEPVCEPPAIALYYISKLARKYVTVLISGEGGDEAFAGYPNYRTGQYVENLKRSLGPAAKPLAGAMSLLGGAIGSAKIPQVAYMMSHPVESYYWGRTTTPARFATKNFDSLYSMPFKREISKDHSVEPLREILRKSPDTGIVNKMLYVDTKSWLPDDLLIKADKMTMANSLELRVPLLDHEVLEFAASLPPNLKVRGNTTKYLAKKTLEKHVPEEIVKRKKAGFPTPYAAWLRTDLRDWVRDLLLSKKAESRGYFQSKTVEKVLNDDLQGGGYSKEIFSLAVLELWHQRFIDSGSPRKPEPQSVPPLEMNPAQIS